MIRPNHPYAIFVETTEHPLTLLVHAKTKKEALDCAKKLQGQPLKRIEVRYSPVPYEAYEDGTVVYSFTK